LLKLDCYLISADDLCFHKLAIKIVIPLIRNRLSKSHRKNDKRHSIVLTPLPFGKKLYVLKTVITCYFVTSSAKQVLCHKNAQKLQYIVTKLQQSAFINMQA